MIFSLVLSILFIGVLFFDLSRRMSFGRAILSPIFYFSCLWFMAFPLHACLLFYGWVDTQQKVVIHQGDMIAAVWLSLASLFVVYCGTRTARVPMATQSFVDNKVDNRRLCIVSAAIAALIVLAIIFLSQIASERGVLLAFSGNEQNEARVGSGPLFMLAELFIYGLIGAVAALLSADRRKGFWVLLLIIFAAGLILAAYMGIVLTSRRIIVLPLFALALAWLYTYCKRPRLCIVLGVSLLAGTIIATPALNSLRYVAAPPPIEARGGNAASVVIGHCRWVGHTPVPQQAVTILDANGKERMLSGFSAHVAMKFCDQPLPGVYLFTQAIASSYGLVDHLATFLHKARLSEILGGVDHGVAWSYNVVLALVPRAIWEEKPLHYGSVAIQKWLYPEMYKDNPVTMTLPPSFIVDFLYGFGLPSLLALCFTLGRFLDMCHVWLISGLQNRKYTRFIIGLFVMSCMFNVVRGGTGFIQSIIIMISISAFMYCDEEIRNFFIRVRRDELK